MTKRIFNFSAGPATLPLSVLQEASKGVLEIDGSGMSILEVSHRGKHYEKIHFEARDRLLKLLKLNPNDYSVIFMGGGASLQFAMLPMNYLSTAKSADYVHTGEWSSKAMKEAKRFGGVKVVASSEDKKFSCIPKSVNWSAGAAYAHITTNNTIEGTEFSQIPNTGSAPLVADMSSDFMARDLDHSRFSMIYAGAQKNAGPAGVTIMVIKKDFLDQASEDVPAILSYKTHAKNDSLYNTPPVFSIYTFGLVLKWIENQGGLGAIDQANRKKAGLIYSALDEHPHFYDPAVTDPSDRSLMNITFRLKDPSKEAAFLKGAEALGMDGLKGHRSVGGFRASIYNAFPHEGCVALATYLHSFAKQ